MRIFISGCAASKDAVQSQVMEQTKKPAEPILTKKGGMKKNQGNPDTSSKQKPVTFEVRLQNQKNLPLSGSKAAKDPIRPLKSQCLEISSFLDSK